MPRKPRKKAEDKLLLTMACGASVENAARQCQLSKRTVYRRIEEPEFRRQIQALRADMVQRTSGALTAAGSEAVRALLELLRGARAEAVRLGAARSVLEIGMKAREFAELEERLALLEQQAEMNNSR